MKNPALIFSPGTDIVIKKDPDGIYRKYKNVGDSLEYANQVFDSAKDASDYFDYILKMCNKTRAVF